MAGIIDISGEKCNGCGCEGGAVVDCNDHTITVDIENTLPPSFTGDPKFIFLRVSNTVDIDITGYAPTGICYGTILRVQNLSQKNLIEFTDSNVNYKFNKKRGEVITLVWSESNIFEII